MATSSKKSARFVWRGQGTFIVIAAGATLSLNDFLTFPVLAGQNGGGAFLLLYMFFLALLGLPLLMSELMLGRMSRANIIGALGLQADKRNASIHWKFVGFFALLAGFLILSSYSVVSGWSLAYFFKTGLGFYSGATADGVNALFGQFQSKCFDRKIIFYRFIVDGNFTAARRQPGSGDGGFTFSGGVKGIFFFHVNP